MILTSAVRSQPLWSMGHLYRNDKIYLTHEPMYATSELEASCPYDGPHGWSLGAHAEMAVVAVPQRLLPPQHRPQVPKVVDHDSCSAMPALILAVRGRHTGKGGAASI